MHAHASSHRYMLRGPCIKHMRWHMPTCAAVQCLHMSATKALSTCAACGGRAPLSLLFVKRTCSKHRVMLLYGAEHCSSSPWFGIVCSTWVWLSRATTGRSYCTVLGNGITAAAQANIMVSIQGDTALQVGCCIGTRGISGAAALFTHASASSIPANVFLPLLYHWLLYGILYQWQGASIARHRCCSVIDVL